MSFPEQNRAFELLKEKFDRHEKILIQAYKSLKQKEQELVRLNHELQVSEEKLNAKNEELHLTNEQLMTAYEEIKAHNDNLDELVKKRSKKIEEQLNLFHEYAFLNAHEIRAPLARILGLVSLLEYNEKKEVDVSLLSKLKESAIELDNVVRSLNRLLEKGTFPRSND
jgi:signal transduction histidine kinase